MKLHAGEIRAFHDRREGRAVLAAGFGKRVYRGTVAMHKIEARLRLDTVEQRGLTAGEESVPAHVRHGDAGGVRQQSHAAGDHAERLGRALRGALEQHLHAEADAQHGLGEAAHAIDEALGLQAPHALGGGADAG